MWQFLRAVHTRHKVFERVVRIAVEHVVAEAQKRESLNLAPVRRRLKVDLLETVLVAATRIAHLYFVLDRVRAVVWNTDLDRERTGKAFSPA